MKTLRVTCLGLLVITGCAAEVTARDYVEVTQRQSERADEAAARGDHGAAVEALDELVALSVPSSMNEEHARVIRQDAHDRLARSTLVRGDPSLALRHVEAGLALGEREDLFTANLLTTRGRIYEMQGRDAAAAREYHRALGIHEALLDDALGDGR